MKFHGILWEGPSPLDGKPIVAIVTYPRSASQANSKTGVMAQVYILRQDIAPLAALKTKDDVSICGFCPMRDPRSCYVNVGQGPTSVWKTYKAGKYKPVELDAACGLGIRWGAYGDPAMIPEAIVKAVNARAAFHLGYTHQWRYPWAAWTRGVFMASVEGKTGRLAARKGGWGTFEARAEEPSPIEPNTPTLCLNERTGAKCEDCRECDGSLKSIWIPAHGFGKNNIPAARLLRRKEAVSHAVGSSIGTIY
jgi:hypothetical protein